MARTSAWLAALTLLTAGTARAATPAPLEPSDATAPAEEPAPVGPGEATPPTTSEPSETLPPAEPVVGVEPAASTPHETTPAAEPAAASPSSATTSSAASPSPAASPSAAAADAPVRTYPRLVIAGGPIVGPHALGNEQCDAELGRCETKGSFLGLGGQIELRVRLWRMIQAHVRGLAVGNVARDKVHRGLAGAGAGVGLAGRRAFGRAEYLLLSTFGDDHFEPPFFEGEVGTDEWGHHAGMLSVGFRQPLPHRLAAELWGGLVIGPRSVRTISNTTPDERVLTTFLVGLNVSWDAVP